MLLVLLKDSDLFLPFLVVVGANPRRNRETGWNRDAQPTHFGQIRAFAAQEVLHFGVSLGFAVSKEIDVFRLLLYHNRLLVLPLRRCLGAVF